MRLESRLLFLPYSGEVAPFQVSPGRFAVPSLLCEWARIPTCGARLVSELFPCLLCPQPGENIWESYLNHHQISSYDPEQRYH